MKKKLEKFAPVLILVILVFLVFRAWFGFGEITAGDTGFFFKENLKDFTLLPFIWDNRGMGQFSPLLFSFFYLTLPIKILSLFNFPWSTVERLIWYWPFIIISLFSSWYFFKTILPKTKLSFLSPLIYLLNTYILMIVGGGQISIALAYAIFPLVIALFIRNVVQKNLKTKIISGLILSLLMAFEPRMASLALLVALVYALVEFRLAILKYLETFLIPLVIVVGVHFYWLLPLIFLRKGTSFVDLTTQGWVEFLSFADFSDSLSLLHPNWPENIFGKTYFMRPEFLVIPILAFISLVFTKRLKNLRVKKDIFFFASLVLVGAFLAKGSKPPFGEIYLWLFNHLPGMNLFRDSSKFYFLVALSYSLLIPFSLEQMIELSKKAKIKYLVLFGFVLTWLLLIRPAWLGQLRGTFKIKTVPSEYLVLKDFILNQEDFFRTLWIPREQRFTFSNHQHPLVSSEEPLSQEDLALMGVKYVIIPYDSEEEIFLKDRKYDHQQRLALEEKLDEISWLKKIEMTDKIAVYETPGYQDHFFAVNGEVSLIDWRMVNPSKYLVRLSGATRPFELVFSETYDELWQAKIGEKKIQAKESKNSNSFSVNQTGDLEIVIEFVPQQFVYWGGVVSILTLLFAGGYLIFNYRQKET